MCLPAHLDPVRLPSLRRSERPSKVARQNSAPTTAVHERATRAPESDGVQIMQPAPALPSVLDEDWAASPVALPPPPVAAVAAQAAAPPTATDPAISAWRLQVQQPETVQLVQQGQLPKRKAHRLLMACSTRPIVRRLMTT